MVWTALVGLNMNLKGSAHTWFYTVAVIQNYSNREFRPTEKSRAQPLKLKWSWGFVAPELSNVEKPWGQEHDIGDWNTMLKDLNFKYIQDASEHCYLSQWHDRLYTIMSERSQGKTVHIVIAITLKVAWGYRHTLDNNTA